MRNFFGGDPHFNNVVLQLPLRVHTRDESKFGRTITLTDAPVVKDGATYFDGTNDGLTFADASEFDLGTLDYTVEARVYLTATTGNRVIAMLGDYTLGGGVVWYISGGKLSVYQANVGYEEATASVPASTWAHVAWVRKAGVVSFFCNGVRVHSATISSAITPATYFSVGYDVEYSNAYLAGYLKDLRITKGVARYTSNFTPPLALPAPHGVAKLSRRVPIALPEARRPPFLAHAPSAARRPLALRPGRALNQDLQLTSFVDFTDGVDLVRGEGTVLSGGAARVIRAQGPNTEHDAADDRTQIAADSRDIIPTDGNITIFAHIYPWGAAAGYTHGFGVKRVGTSGTHTERCGTHLPYTDGKIYFDYGGVVEGTTRISVTMPTSSHRSVYAFTCGPRGMEIWHNGVRIANNSATPTLAAYADAYMLGVHGEVSSEINLTSNRFNCYAFGISRRQLPYGTLQNLTRSPEDMWNVVMPRQATRIPTYMKSESRRPPVLVDLLGRGDIHFNNVALQLSLRSHLRDESKSLTVMTISGTPTTNLGGMYFNGSSRLYTTSTAALNNPFTTDYTIEAYVRASDWTSWSHLGDGVQHGHMYGNSDLNTIHWWSFGPRNDGKLSVFYYGPGEKVSTRTLLTNTWHHVAMVTDKKANVLRLFIDGQQDSTHAIPSCSNSSYISVAFGQNQYLTGYIRDLRVTPGIARYTSNFTPPMMLPTHGVASASYGIE